MSGQILNVPLSDCEAEYDKAHPQRHHDLALGRYVDDLAAMSKTLCVSCVKLIVYLAYYGVIEFDPETKKYIYPEEGTVVHPFLDMFLHLSWDSFSIEYVCKNEKYAITGDTVDLVKRSLMPSTGSLSPAMRNKQRSELKGRIHRWCVLIQSNALMLHTVVIDMLLFCLFIHI